MADKTWTEIPKLTLSRAEKAWRVAALVAVLFLGGIGCSPLSTLGWFMAGDDLKEPIFDLTVPDKESKVVFICVHGNPSAVSDIFRNADEIVCSRLTSTLAQRYKENKTKVTIVPGSKVNSYLQDHPGWVTKSKQEIGKHFNADYVVYLELGRMSLYEPNSQDTLLRGTVDVSVKVYPVNVGEGERRTSDTVWPCLYPRTQPEDAISTNRAKFREDFLNNVAKGLVPLFVASPPTKKMDWD